VIDLARQLNKEVYEKVLAQQGGNFSAVARKFGVTRATLWKIVKGGKEPGGEYIEKFKLAFPEIDLEEVFIMTKP
jgi:DNA-binding phage protein